MAVPSSVRKHLDDHLSQAEFALKVAANFACIQTTPAYANVRAAMVQVEEARKAVRQHITVSGEPVAAKAELPVGTKLPLTRKERQGYRWP